MGGRYLAWIASRYEQIQLGRTTRIGAFSGNHRHFEPIHALLPELYGHDAPGSRSLVLVVLSKGTDTVEKVTRLRV
jgi:hypothetical protein